MGLTPKNRLVQELSKSHNPDAREDGVYHYSEDKFDPWNLVDNCVYGSYSSEFDGCAIDVLQELRDKRFIRSDLGAQMFREMLCVMGYCSYGTSPRVCFWDLDDSLLEELISKWIEYMELEWG